MKVQNLKERNQENRIRFRQNLFTGAMVILAIKNVTDSSFIMRKPGILDNAMILAFMALIGIKLLTQRYTWQKMLMSVALVSVCTYTCIKCSYFYLVFTSLIICAMQDVDLKKTLRATSYVKMLLLSVHVLVYTYDLFARPWKVIYSYRTGGNPRMTFYQGHANTFAMYVCWTSLEFLYANEERLKTWHIGVVWFVNYIFYNFCDSNTSFIVSTFTCLLLVVRKILKNRSLQRFENIIAFLSRYLYGFLSVFFVGIIIGYVNGLFEQAFKVLDKLFTGRLLYGAVAYDLRGISWIGKAVWFDPKIYWRGHWIDAMIFDNCFIWMFISYGVIYLVLISIAFAYYGKKMSTVDKIFVLVYTMYTVMEAYVMNAAICFPLMLVGLLFSKHYSLKDRAYKRALQVKNG
ncbi:hypothetical protein SAMN06296386_103111 [Lachnospiraceae bacterium]|nr:hypothetical protein SAMN06296386_103111 [Lachnospiraceae bacterium]